MTQPRDPALLTARRLGGLVGPLRRSLLRASRAAAVLPDVPEAQVEVLRALDGAGGSSPSALAARLGLARPTVSNLLSAMEGAGLVERRASGGDGRRTGVHLTPLAVQRLRAYDEAATGVLLEALGSLPEEDLRALTAALPALERLHRRVADDDADAPAPGP